MVKSYWATVSARDTPFAGRALPHPGGSDRYYLQLRGVLGQCRGYGGEAFLTTVDDTIGAAARMWTKATATAFHRCVLCQSCGKAGPGSDFVSKITFPLGQ